MSPDPFDCPSTPNLSGPGIARSLALCVVFYIIFGAASLLLSWLLGAIRPLAELSLDSASSVLVPQIAAWLVTIHLGLQWAKVSFREACPLTTFPVRIVPALLVTSCGAIVLLAEVAGLIPMPESIREAFIKFSQGPVLARFAMGVVVAALAEEMFFRGLVLRGFLGRYSVTKAIWASSILFALFHLNPWQMVTALPLGIWFAWMTLRTGSLLPGIIGHATVNFTGFFLISMILRAYGYSAEEVLELKHFPLSMLCIAGAMTAIGGFILWRQITSISPPAGNSAIDAKIEQNEQELSNPESQTYE